jgi:hypothetical protein
MQKAYLFEALYKFNEGIDAAVCGVRRLLKAPPLSLETYEEGAAELELRRAKVNVQFLDDLREVEQAEVARWDEKYGELIDEPLDHAKICQLMRVVEQQRREEGKPPMVAFTEAAPPMPKLPDEPQPNAQPTRQPAATAA